MVEVSYEKEKSIWSRCERGRSSMVKVRGKVYVYPQTAKIAEKFMLFC